MRRGVSSTVRADIKWRTLGTEGFPKAAVDAVGPGIPVGSRDALPLQNRVLLFCGQATKDLAHVPIADADLCLCGEVLRASDLLQMRTSKVKLQAK